MLDKIKSLLTFVPQVEYVDFEDGLLTFRAEKPLTGNVKTVKLKTSYGTLTAHIAIQSFDDEIRVYRAELLNYEVVLDALAIDRRDNVRLPKVVRVTSGDLPGYAGVTEDISVTGSRVSTSGPLETGEIIDLKIELDDPEIPPMTIASQVCWTSRKADNTYHSGLRFQNLDPKKKKMILRYVEDRLALERKLHTLETD